MLARYAASLSHRIRKLPDSPEPFDWTAFVPGSGSQVISENVASAILEAAGLSVAKGRIAATAEDAVRAAEEVGFPVAHQGNLAARHASCRGGIGGARNRLARGRAQDVRDIRAARDVDSATLDGVWAQHMFEGSLELLVTAFRDAEFGVMVGVGMGGAMTEIIDDVAFTRAPIDADGAFDLLGQLRTLRRLPELLNDTQRRLSAEFVAKFSALAATAPWDSFTFEVNPLKIGTNEVAAVDGLLLIE